MTWGRMSVLVVAGMLLAGCGTALPHPGESPTPSAPSVVTPSPSGSGPSVAPGVPAVVAGFELAGDALIAVDALGAPIATYPFTDPAALIGALAAFHGIPYTGAAAPGCDVQVAVWPDEFGPLVVAHLPATGALTVIVKDDDYAIQPSEGPRFGESATGFIAALPASSVGEIGYVYDPVGAAADGRDIGGVAFVDIEDRVTSLASPTVASPGDFC